MKDQLKIRNKRGSVKYLILFFLIVININGHSQNKIRIACVGNSITYGARIENRETNSYPAQLGAMLGSNYEVGNFGVSGTTLLQKGNAPYRKTTAYQKALDFQPDWVFIKLGTNDTKPANRIFLNEYVQDYKDLIASFRQLPSHPRVVLLLPVPVFSTDTTGITARVVSEKLLPMVRQIAYETDCEVINLFNLLINSPELVPDKVHPNAAGATVIAKRIYELVSMKSDTSSNLSKTLPADAKPFNFYGFEGYEFTFQDRDAKIVVPQKAAPGHPWVWRARFWGHEPQVEIALLERGFHVVYCDVVESFLNNEALSIWNGFYQLLTKAGLSNKSVMVGMSRGGIYVYRWAATYPERVVAVYADAPMLDIKLYSKGKEHGFPQKWADFKRVFDFDTEEEALAFKGNPLDLTETIAKAGFPMLHVVGDADEVVPVAEHTALFEQKIKEAGSPIRVIHKPGVNHHPHSLPNPQPIVDFVLMATDYLAAQDMMPIPSAPQLRWQQQERLMFVHFAPNTWTGLGQDDNSLPLERINPTKLNTDQWCEAAKSWGAKMIVFVAKHSGGFCWWQTNTTDYSAKNIPWKDGKGDLLADISKSCEKYGLDLGVYIYPGDKTWGAGLGSGGKTKDPAKQEAYNKVFRQQLAEVLSRYKPMKEVWFDGSCVIDIADILEKYASDAVIFQGPQATIRWVGNEKGIAPYPNWYTVRRSVLDTGRSTALSSDPDGEVYAPVEVDVPFLMNSKSYRWFWAPGTDSMLLSVPALMDIHQKSVGRGSVLLLNSTPDTTGLIPKSHMERYRAFGKELDKRFNHPIASTSGSSYVIELDLGKTQPINYAVIREDIAKGQRVRKYGLEGYSDGKWVKIKDGSSIGNKRIEEFPTMNASKIRLRVKEAVATPYISEFSLYHSKKLDIGASQSAQADVPVTIGDWSSRSFTSEWQDYTVGLSPYLVEYVGQFELKFHVVDHDRAFEKQGTGGYGLELEDSYFEVNGEIVSGAVSNKGNNTFLINHSQHITKSDHTEIVFKTKVKTKPGRSVGTIELRKIEFE